MRLQLLGTCHIYVLSQLLILSQLSLTSLMSWISLSILSVIVIINIVFIITNVFFLFESEGKDDTFSLEIGITETSTSFYLIFDWMAVFIIIVNFILFLILF